jgi:hypothetical protein
MVEEQVRRPAAAVAIGVVLVLTALVSALAGLAASWVSNCCGSADGSDPVPAVLGLAVATLLVLAAAGLVGGWMRRWLVVSITAVVPVACLVAASTSSDLASAAPFALAGWGVLAWLVSRPPVAPWLSRNR